MNTAKTLLTATGIGLILGGVYFGLGEIPMPNPSAGSTSSLQASSGQAPSVQVSKTIPDAVTSLETIPTNITPRVESLTSFKKETVTTENLTQRFVQEIGEKLAQKNPVGPELIQGQNWFNAPDPTTLANELIAEMSSKFSFNDLKPIITKNDIIISDTATKEAIAIYAARVETILEKAGNKIPENILVAPEQRTAEDLALLVRIYGETIKDFYALPVPRTALDIHIQQITLLAAKKAIYTAVIEFEKDPLAALFAAQSLEKINSEFEILSQKFSEFIQNSNI